jgi:tryptophanyl-tRNA synthetase
VRPTSATTSGRSGTVRLQWEYEAIYCIVDYHALTSLHDAERLRRQTREMAAALLALGLDPERCTLFVQSHRPEHTELAWLLMTVTPVSWLERTPTYKEKKANQPDDVNHGLLSYPVLQAADIVIYKASLVPVGKDQAAHLELSREIVRGFNARYGETFPEPTAVHTEAPIVLGTDGVRKMSKSIGNTIDIFAPEAEIRSQIMSMVTDTKRILRTDPGRPEVCNVCQLHRSFGDDYEEIWEGERTARTGCVDTKKLLVERVLQHYAEPRARYLDCGRLRHARSHLDRAPSAPARSPGHDGRSARKMGPADFPMMDDVRPRSRAPLARRDPRSGPWSCSSSRST